MFLSGITCKDYGGGRDGVSGGRGYGVGGSGGDGWVVVVKMGWVVGGDGVGEKTAQSRRLFFLSRHNINSSSM